MSDFSRARSDEQRAARRESILATAAEMLNDRRVAALSLNELARQVGLAKSNVLRYFESREAVLLELYDREYRSWLDDLEGRLDAADARDIEHVATVMADTIVARPVFCDLCASAPGVLEHNVSAVVARAYKHSAIANVTRLAQVVGPHVGGWSPAAALGFVAAVNVIIGGVWASSQPSPGMALAYREDPSLQAKQIGLHTLMREFLATVLTGLAHREPAGLGSTLDTPGPTSLDRMTTPWTDLAKVSLHDHLDGSLRVTTVLGLSEAPPADTVEGLREWINERSLSGNLVEYLESFSLTGAVLQTAENLERVAREYVLDLAADGVVYGEVRWAPELSHSLPARAAVEAVSSGLRSGERETGITVRQILIGMRQGHRVPEIAELALALREADVVAFDLAGPEKGFPPSLFAPTLDILHREWMPVTIHAGEADGLASIASALVDGHALRLGHGVRIADDVRVQDGQPVLGRLAQWVRDREIVLETSPTSNFHTAAFAGEQFSDHPFALLDRAGFTVTVNTDNRLMSDTTISAELERLSTAFGFTLADHERFQLNAAAGAFLPEPSRRELAQKIRASFASAGLASGHVPH